MAKRTPKETGNQKGKEKRSSPAQKKTKSTAKPSKSGQTRMINGSMEYLGNGGWMPAVYHCDIRARLLAEGPQGTYDFPRKRGKEADNITSFHPSYQTTGPDREHRHEILFQYQQDEHPRASYTPGPLMSHDQIVLDTEDNPVRNWNEIPLVLSSAYEGYEMEVVRRLNPDITYQDFRARMPRFIMIGTRRETVKLSTLSMRNGRFRLPACCLAWEGREGSNVIKDYSFRDLTDHEVKEAKDPNRGNFPERAGGRALDDETRRQRDEIHKQRSAKLLQEHYNIVGAAPQPAIVNPEPRTRNQKRKRVASSIDPEDREENTRFSKRQQGAMGTEIPRGASRSADVKPAPQKGTGAQNRKQRDDSFDTEDEQENIRLAKRRKRRDRSFDTEDEEEDIRLAKRRKRRDRSFDRGNEEEDTRLAKRQEFETGLGISWQNQGISASGSESASSQGDDAEYPDLSGVPPRFEDLVWHQPMDEPPLDQPIFSHPASTLPASTQRTSSQPASASHQQAVSQPDLGGLPPRFEDLVWHQPMDEPPLDQPIFSHPASTLPASTQRTSSQPASAPPQQPASQPDLADLSGLPPRFEDIVWQTIDQPLLAQLISSHPASTVPASTQRTSSQPASTQQLIDQQLIDQQLIAQQQQIIAQQIIAWRPTPQDEPNGRGRDYRFVPPRHSHDDLSLQMALCHTRCEIKELVRPLDLELNATLGTSYWDQWQEIVQSYLYHWPLVSKGKEPPPVLIMAPFYKDHRNWRLPKGY